MRITFSPQAQADIEAQAEWYGQRSASRAKGSVATVELECQQIAQRPESAPQFGPTARRKRQMQHPYHRFAIVCRILPDEIKIVAVWAAARNPAGLAER